ncbi:MAG: hypothetical protein EF813_06790 [Methanosarcinales archaeon]|nr:MAG: hypothetical protein EF813_06790 [Methanosarcinales archaeon]
MNNTTKKEKWWIYLIFLFVGIISVFAGFFIGSFPLFDGGLLVMLLPLPICSLLLHRAIEKYGTEKYPYTFVSMALTASILIFLIGLFGGFLAPIEYFGSFGPFFLLLIIFAISLIIFKNDHHKKFAITAFTISFASIFLIFGAAFALSGYNHEMAAWIHIREITTIDENTPYMEIHEQELEAFPGFKDALNQYRESGECYQPLLPDEWGNLKEFFDEKDHKHRYLFTISPGIDNKLPITDYDQDMSPIQSKNIPVDLKLIFESNNISLPEIASIGYNDYNQNWRIHERTFLFVIDNPELIDNLKTMKIYDGDGSLEEMDLITLPELNNTFESNGFSTQEQYGLHRYAQNWHIIPHTPDGGYFYIWEENGNLNVYTNENITYEIWKEDGNLNVYKKDVHGNPTIFEVGDDYYTFSFSLA